MALNFPLNPVLGQTYSSSGKSWRWTGTVWQANTDVFISNFIPVSALDIDCGVSNYFTKTIAGNSIFTFSNVPSGVAYTFILELTHTSGTVTWPVSVTWPESTTPSLTAGKTHVFIFTTDDGGVRWRGAANANYTN